MLIHHGTPTTSLLLLSTNSVSSRLDGPTFSFGSFFLLPFFSLIPTTATNRRSFGGTHAGGTTVGRSQGSRKRVPPAPCYPAFSSSRHVGFQLETRTGCTIRRRSPSFFEIDFPVILLLHPRVDRVCACNYCLVLERKKERKESIV